MNVTDLIGAVAISGSSTVFGSLAFTLLAIFVISYALCVFFQIPLDWASVIITPLLFGLMAYYQEFLVIGVVLLLYWAFIVTKRFILR